MRTCAGLRRVAPPTHAMVLIAPLLATWVAVHATLQVPEKNDNQSWAVQLQDIKLLDTHTNPATHRSAPTDKIDGK